MVEEKNVFTEWLNEKAKDLAKKLGISVEEAHKLMAQVIAYNADPTGQSEKSE